MGAAEGVGLWGTVTPWGSTVGTGEAAWRSSWRVVGPARRAAALHQDS